METRNLEGELARLAKGVDARLEELLPPEDASPSELHGAMRYSALAPGKRLRPALVLACAGREDGAALDAACAVEMVHAFSLIHDDLPALDDDDLRRGRPACHVEFGEAVAILAGDALFALAFDTIARLEAPPAATVAILRELTEAVGTRGLVGGEMIDILMENRTVDAATLRDIHARKTGALLAAACAIGGIAGERPPAEVDALREYGARLGLAFQIADDVLNETSTREELGKAAGSDGDRGKATYPGLFGIDAARRMAAEAAESARSALPAGEATLAALAAYAVERRR